MFKSKEYIYEYNSVFVHVVLHPIDFHCMGTARMFFKMNLYILKYIVYILRFLEFLFI